MQVFLFLVLFCFVCVFFFVRACHKKVILLGVTSRDRGKLGIRIAMCGTLLYVNESCDEHAWFILGYY